MALYHKYRPQLFSDVVDQEHIITTLTNQIREKMVAHAYLFSGPRGVGKTTTARILTKALNCEKRKDDAHEPCNDCTSCDEISRSRAIDVIEIDAASHTGVDNVRENIIENAQFRPTKSPYKIFIIDEVHMLSASAFNALLKTLEEPPAHVIFILATTELAKLPDTIVSRCQRFHFRKIPYGVMKQYLEIIAKKEDIAVEASVLGRVIAKSDGCARDAVSLLDQLMATGEKKVTIELAAALLPTSDQEATLAFLDACFEKRAADALAIVADGSARGVDWSQFADDLLRLLRALLVTQVNARLEAINADLSDLAKKKLRALADLVPPKTVLEFTDRVLTRRQDIAESPIPELPIEMLVIGWCSSDGSSERQTPLPEEKPGHHQKTDVVLKKTDAAPGVKVSGNKKTIAERVKHMVMSEPPCTLEAARSAWAACTRQFEESSPSLAFVLQTAVLETVEGNTMRLAVPYQLHQDTLIKNKENQKKIEASLAAIIGSTVSIAVTVAPVPAREPDDLSQIRSLTAVFGGEVI